MPGSFAGESPTRAMLDASGGALLLEPFLDAVTGTGRGSMTFSPEHIERQIELAQRAGFDMHIHIDADGSARVVLDAIASVQRRIGRERAATRSATAPSSTPTM
jgi:predicted amidohydrolase YtcJ